MLGDEPIIKLLIDWAVTTQRTGEHRAVVAAKLLERRQNEIRMEVNCPMFDFINFDISVCLHSTWHCSHTQTVVGTVPKFVARVASSECKAIIFEVQLLLFHLPFVEVW